jgi:hydrogenase maturation protease
LYRRLIPGEDLIKAEENTMKNADAAMKQTVVLGIGNRLMGDDGIGVRLAEVLGQRNPYENVRFIAGETDVDYCLNELAGADLCIIIDGARSAGDIFASERPPAAKGPCSVEVTDLKGIFAQKRPMASFHDFDLIHAMKRENLMKDGILITVEIYTAEFSEELSEPLRERFDEIAEEVRDRMDRYLSIDKIS